ncbi:hypothetical protein [Candidatus Symbiobacter mobilis]|uniref:Uncharacterized protein n=1 Tax=Candidatus Symbiobacter mobilis CR TaxID=946483 RepID=U5N5N0_9BURK|nr:hypothetical protein [Candidatus Symbiobacter mobilis]AGX86570.1 hypothetical protein Cenrod_0453 [Candidatus Symbiobacter mobilis CR]
MSLLRWFLRRSIPATNPHTASSRPQPGSPPPKTQRQDHRQHVYQVVREVMLRSEILAASYSFKVLTLDREGRQFVVMIDVRDPRIVRQDIMADLERCIVDSAQSQHSLLIKSVYWRCTSPLSATNDVGMTTAARIAASATSAGHTSTATAPAAASPAASASASAATSTVSPPPRTGLRTTARDPARSGTFFDPIGTDEVLAFRQALDPTPTSSGLRKTPDPKKKRPTGFEDTELLEEHEPPSPLSNTQYGDL